ncbi:MAG: acylneuraminate cytidylyltransferase family protein [Candidatus Sungbacteria bacterium]|nr:acylneuraminate cytidylyltransferase family protein [Candidatus Sungbacteria bacterium]
MTQNPKKILGLITARGGSKGIPGKNIKELAGKPLIAYTIEAAHASGVFDRVIVSTDDEKIADVAKAYGCTVPFMRPAELAGDTTPHNPVLRHALEWLRDKENYVPDLVMILQPTAPLRTAAHIRDAAAMFETSGADSVVSVAEIPNHYHPRWQFTFDEGNRMAIFTGEPFSQIVRRRQDLSKTYTRNGAIYLIRATRVLDPNENNFYGDHVTAYIMNPEESINIDTMEDWKEAERILNNKY